MPTLTDLVAQVQPWLLALEATSVGRYVRTATFAYPIAEIVHLIGVATLFGTILWIDWNVLRPQVRWPLEQWGRAALRLTMVGFALALISGSLMFVARATEMAANPVFWLKMGLLLLAGLNAALFHQAGAWAPASLRTRSQALLSLLLWVAVLSCGRMIAYV